MTSAAYRTLVAGTVAAASLGLLAGCSTTTSSPGVTQTVTAAAPSAPATPSADQSTPAAAAVSASVSASASASASAGTGTSSASSVANTTKVDPNAPAGQCKDSALKVTVQYDPEAAGAGQRGAFVVFRNTGSSPCHLEGTPGLSLVGGGNGTQIGKPAQRTTSGAKLVTLKFGGTALAQVQYTYIDKNGGNYNDGNGHDTACKAKPADGYRVYPPHSYRASFTAMKTYACSTDLHWISVSPVRPASDFKYFTPKT